MKQVSLTTGIISVVCAVACWFIFGIGFSIAGLVLGIIAVMYSSKSAKEGEPCTAGLVLGIIGIIGSAIGLLVLIISFITIIMAAASGNVII